MAVKKTPVKKSAFATAKVNQFKRTVKDEAKVISKEGKEF